MRHYCFEVSNGENWRRRRRLVRVKANTLKGAFRRARKKIRYDEVVYQVTAGKNKRRGYGQGYLVWDYWNGSKIY